MLYIYRNLLIGWDDFQEFIDLGPYLKPSSEEYKFKFYTYSVQESVTTDFQFTEIDCFDEATRIHEKSFANFNFDDDNWEGLDDDRKAWEILGLKPPEKRNQDGSKKSSWSNTHLNEEDEDLRSALEKVDITNITIDQKTGTIRAQVTNIYPRYSLLGIKDLVYSKLDIEEKIAIYKATQPNWSNDRTRDLKEYEQEIADRIQQLSISHKAKEWAYLHLYKNLETVIQIIPQTSELNVYLVPEFRNGYYNYPTFSFAENSRELINRMGIPFHSMNIHMVSDFVFCFKEHMSDDDAEQKLKDLGFNYKTPDEKKRAVEGIELDAPTILEL